jgi:hypothetical protein
MLEKQNYFDFYSRVVDPHCFNPDPDSAFLLNCNADLDPAFPFNVDPFPDPASLQIDGNLRPLDLKLSKAPF